MAGQSRNPRISYLTTAYRTERYLPAMMDSVQAQTNSDWELVVVDNGNSESIAEIVRLYLADPRIRLVRQENRGYRGGVMAAAAQARGDYLCVLDSDDALTVDHAEKIAAFLDENPEVDAVGCDAHTFLDGDERSFGGGYFRSVGKRRSPRRGQRLTVPAVLAGWVPYYSSAIRREAWWAVGGYDPGIADVAEEVLTWLNVAERFDARLVPDKLGFYRMRGDSLSRDPEKVEAYEEGLIGAFEIYAAGSSDPAAGPAVDHTVRHLRYMQALRKSRWSFQDGAIPHAKRFAVEAWRQKRTARVALIIGSLSVAPGLVRAVYPLKQRAGRWVIRVQQRFGSAAVVE